jgi:hypothetical protein
MPDPVKTETPAAAAGTTATQTAADTVERAKYDEVAGRLGSALQKLDALEKAAAAKDEAALAEQGKWKELAERQKVELDTLAVVKARADESTAVIAKLIREQADGVDKVIADAIIDNPTYTLDEKVEKIKAVKKAVKQPAASSPASETPGLAGFKSPEELFAKIKDDMSAQIALGVDNPNLYKEFRKWRASPA